LALTVRMAGSHRPHSLLTEKRFSRGPLSATESPTIRLLGSME